MFWKSKIRSPITLEDREWIEQSFLWLKEKFGEEYLRKREVVLPTKSYFDKKFNGDQGDAFFVFERVGKFMDINLERINLQLYSEQRPMEYSENIISLIEDNVQLTSGRYIQYNDGTVARFSPNPDEFIKDHRDSLLSSEEIQLLKRTGVIGISALIDVKEKRIIKLTKEGLTEVNDDLMKKILDILVKNISVSPKKYVSTAPDYRYIVKGFSINVHENKRSNPHRTSNTRKQLI